VVAVVVAAVMVVVSKGYAIQPKRCGLDAVA